MKIFRAIASLVRGLSQFRVFYASEGSLIIRHTGGASLTFRTDGSVIVNVPRHLHYKTVGAVLHNCPDGYDWLTVEQMHVKARQEREQKARKHYLAYLNTLERAGHTREELDAWQTSQSLETV